MCDKVNLDNLKDIQKVWLCDLSFVDITKEGYEKIFNGGLTINELRNYVKNPDLPFCGDVFIGVKRFNMLIKYVIGNNKFPTNLDVVEELINNGLGSLKIIHSSEYPKLPSSGFQALTFEDSYGNIGISYRGSEMYFSKVIAREWLESNVFEYFVNSSTQVKEAQDYFCEHKTLNGNNYIFGHSLGGNLVSHVYLLYYKEIAQAFSINGTPINQKLIDTKEKVEAFNDSTKFQFNVVCGDVISQLKSCEIYKDNVNYIKNNDLMKSTVISAHMIQASTFDENGNFIKITESEMKENTNKIRINLINLSKLVREKMNGVNFKLVNDKLSPKDKKR